MIQNKKFVVTFCLWGFCVWITAEPPVPISTGQAIDVKLLIQQAIKSHPSSANYSPSVAPPDTVDLRALYRVKTDSLTAGTVTSRLVDTKITQPIFIIGDDSVSMDWLTKNSARLKQLHAAGFIVNCSSQSSFDAIIQKTGLSMTPMNGDVFAALFSLTHYPVLITSRSIEQ